MNLHDLAKPVTPPKVINPFAGRWTPAPKGVTPGAVRLSEEAAAEYLGLTRIALSTRRRRGTGPTYYMHMGRIAYDIAVLDAYKGMGQ
ncbi:hypothetical protein [Mycolicibacterium palauense]|uniref:hypothetical protein n=1 Tax=Mycolicibacterium palauense TaxID=2034511 RepID=UPI000BFEE8D9|nr:hypothetical protein [Mycolicibacterium palauense]